jgi:hypothetical protein
MFSAIKTLVRLDGVQNLYILCHGYAGANGTIDFGKWEGTLWKFSPSGSFAAAPGNRVPLELLQV